MGVLSARKLLRFYFWNALAKENLKFFFPNGNELKRSIADLVAIGVAEVIGIYYKK